MADLADRGWLGRLVIDWIRLQDNAVGETQVEDKHS
jgi:hypothetical protein